MAKFEMTTFTAPPKSNEWDEPIAALAEVTDTYLASENADPEQYPAITVFIDWKGRNGELARIRDAAKKVDKTVRIRTEDVSGLTEVGTKENGKKIYQGEIRYVLTLSEKYKDGRGRKPKDADENVADEAPAKGKTAK